LVAGLDTAVAGQPPAKQLSPEEKREYDRIRKRFRNHEGLLSSAGWALIHCADEEEVKNLEKTLQPLRAFDGSDQIPKLVEAGGVKAVKREVAKLLKNKDPVVRGFGAILLAVIGDAGCKNDIARLLEDKRGSPPAEDRFLYNYDRCGAAVALGLMGAEEYAPRLAVLLESSDDDDRKGAAAGLGYMGAKEYVNDIAKLLSDDSHHVQVAAMNALGELGAAEYAKEIAKLLRSGPDVGETACYTLARLNAREQVKELGTLLSDRFRKGDAAKALALLGAKEYTETIAQLVEDSESLVRCDAMIALGILGAKQHVKKVAAHLQDEDTFVRAFAATALLLMGDQTNSKQVVDVVRTEWESPELASDRSHGLIVPQYFSGRIRLHPVVAERQNQLTTQAVRAWKRLSQTKE